jgi:two-component system, LytTR family, sensor kinase
VTSDVSAGFDRRVILAAALTVAAVVLATELYAGYRMQGLRVPYAGLLTVQLCHWELWVVAGPFVWDLERRWPLGSRGALWRHAAAALAVGGAVLAVYLGIYYALVRLPGISQWFGRMDQSFVSTAIFFFLVYFHLELLVYGMVIAAAHAVRTTAILRAKEHDSLRLEAELTGARLAVLRTQLQPHFLFNTLHTIGSLILQQQGERAVQLIAELGELLRSTLAKRDSDLATLREELVDIRRYLKIEEARFGDRLQVELNVEPAALDALVPSFILQPLVENAFRHGIARRTSAATLGISAEIRNELLQITVYNDGPPLADNFSPVSAGGYGLKNVQERLRARRPAGDFEIVNARDGVKATLRMPCVHRDDTRAAS